MTVASTMKKYPRTPSGGGPMVAKIELVRQFEAALAHAPSRDKFLAQWGLTFADAKSMRLGLHGRCLAIPFFDLAGNLLGVKMRKLVAGHAEKALQELRVVASLWQQLQEGFH